MVELEVELEKAHAAHEAEATELRAELAQLMKLNK